MLISPQVQSSMQQGTRQDQSSFRTQGFELSPVSTPYRRASQGKKANRHRDAGSAEGNESERIVELHRHYDTIETGKGADKVTKNKIEFQV